jgi:hypothetical protein
MRLSSSAFSEGSAIPRRFTCDGEDLSPPLEWSGAPAKTCSFVLLCDDPDAPAGTWHHWAAYDISANQTALAAGAAQHGEKQGIKQAINDFQRLAMAAPARHAVTGLITIISDCLRSRSIAWQFAKTHLAETLSAKRASISSPKRPWSAFTRDDHGWSCNSKV